MFLSRLRPHHLLSLSALLIYTGLIQAQDADPAPQPPAADNAPADPAPPTPPAPAQEGSGERTGPPAEGGMGPGGRFPGGPGGPGFGGRRRPGEGGPGFGGTTTGTPGMGPGGSGNIQSTLAQTIRMEGDRIVLQFPNNPVADMLSIYELLTGVTLIKDTNIFNDGAPVSLATPRAVSKEEAVKLIEATLLTNGYAIVMEADGKSARILPARSQSANSVQFSHGVRFYTSALDLPMGETIVTYFMRLDFLDPEEAAAMFSGHVGLSVYGRITPVLTPPGLLLTESSTVIKQLINIREAIDVGDSGSALVTKFIPVEYAEAATIAQIIQATLTAQAQEKETKGINTIRGSAASDGRSRDDKKDEPSRSSSSNNNNSSNNPGNQGNAMMAMPSAQVVADTRLNQILVVSSPEDYAYIASLIAEFDKPLQVDAPYERKLRYAAAVDVLSAITDLLQDTNTGTTQLPGGGTIQQQRAQPLASSSSQLLTGRTTTGTRGGQVLTTSAATGADDTATGGGSASRADLIQGPSEDNAPISVLVGKTRVVADPMANSILVMGRKEAIDKVNGLLDVLDRKPAQVYLSTVIGQLTLGDEFQFGIDYLSALTNRNGTNFSASSINARQDILGNTANRAIGDLRNNVISNAFGPAAGLNVYGAIGDSLDIFVTALESTNRFKVLSRPSVFALNNKKATITSGQLIPVPVQSVVNTNNVGNGNNVTTNIEYRDVVLKLEVVPLINVEGEVTLTIAQVNDTVIGTQLVEPNLIPIIGTEQIVTSVTVPDRNTIVLGGLISEKTDKATGGVPFLSRIPGVGNLFKDTTDSSTRSELIIFIQPQVVTDNVGLRSTSLAEDARTQVGADAAARFPESVDVESARMYHDKEVMELEAQTQGGFFSRMFRRNSTPRAVTNPPPGVRR